MITVLPTLSRALRTITRRRGFAILVVGTLCLAFAAVGTCVSIIDSVLLRPLNYPAADRLVVVRHLAPDLESTGGDHCEATYLYYAGHTKTLEIVGAYAENVVTLTGSREPEQIRIALVTPSILSL